MPPVPPAAFDHLRAAVDLILGRTDQIREIAVLMNPPRIVVSVGIVPDIEPDAPTLLPSDN